MESVEIFSNNKPKCMFMYTLKECRAYKYFRCIPNPQNISTNELWSGAFSFLAASLRFSCICAIISSYTLWVGWILSKRNDKKAVNQKVKSFPELFEMFLFARMLFAHCKVVETLCVYIVQAVLLLVGFVLSDIKLWRKALWRGRNRDGEKLEKWY